MKLLSIRNDIHAPNAQYLSPSEGESLTKERAMAFLIGLLAILLAFGVVWLDEHFAPACARTSISHYFYEPLAGTFFVMVLTFVGAFMIAYRGENRIDGWLATLGGVGGLLLAFFPTEGTGCNSEAVFDFRPAVVVEYPLTFDHVAPDDLDEIEGVPDLIDVNDQAAEIGDAFTQKFHMRGAVGMFAVLFIFCIWVFTRVNDAKDRWPPPADAKDGTKGRLKTGKIIRNAVYLVSSALMAIGVVMILASHSEGVLGEMSRWISALMAKWLAALPAGNDAYAEVIRPVYHGEMLALCAFGVSWIVKGRFGTSVYNLLFPPITRVEAANPDP